MSFGTPSDIRAASLMSTIIAEPTAGAQFHQTPLNRGPGAALITENYIVRNGALELRPVLSHMTGGVVSSGFRGLGGIPYTTVLGEHRAIVADHGGNWYTTSGSDGWAAVTDDGDFAFVAVSPQPSYWDFAQIYSDRTDHNIVIGVPDVLAGSPGGQGAYVLALWEINTRHFLTSTTTQSNALGFGAKCVAAFDNYAILANIRDTASALSFPQRIQWSDRGSASSWTGGLSGFEDLLAARGEIQRVVPVEDRLLVFFDDELWQGTPEAYPFTFRFSQLDAAVGCPFRWTIAKTPAGVLFLSRDRQTYLWPRGGGPLQPVGTPIQAKLQSDISRPERAFALYDPTLQQYELFYAVSSLGSFPRNAAFLDMQSGVWSLQSFTHGLSFGFIARDDRQRFTPVLCGSEGTIYRLTSDYTSDFSNVAGRINVNAFWEHMPFGGAAPATQKSVNLVRVDYDTPSASSLTVRTSPSQGVGYSTGVGLALSPTSTVSQQPAYVRESSRYPAVRIEESSQSLAQRQRIHRLHIEARIGGR